MARTVVARSCGRLGDELGVTTLYQSTLDVKLLCLQRFIRLFAYSGTTLILALFLAGLGLSDTEIGLFMTLTLLGDILLSLLLTFTADRLGRRNVLRLGALAITLSGIAFGLSDNFWVLLAAATVGVISPSANEIGPFRAIEASTVAQLTPVSGLSDVFSWYSLIGNVGQALGTIVSGSVIETLESREGWTTDRAYRIIFFGYGVLGIVKFALCLMLSQACEIDTKSQNLARQESTSVPTSENSCLLPDDGRKKKPRRGWQIASSETRQSLARLGKITFLQSLQAVASGLLVMSWLTYYFNQKFAMREKTLGTILFIVYALKALSTLVASATSKRFGIAKTMAIASLLAGVSSALIPIPTSAPLAVVFLTLRSCTNLGGLRTALVATVFLPEERTAFMGIANVVRTSSQSIGPIITGTLGESSMFWVAFVLSGSMYAAYGVGLIVLFTGHKPKEERDEENDEGRGREGNPSGGEAPRQYGSSA